MIKTFTKHAKTNNGSIPILGMVHVKKGRATATDMDFYITIPTELKDGMYHSHGFDKGFQVKTGFAITDYPQPAKPGNRIGELTLAGEDFDLLRWVLKATSKEATRYYLNGACFDYSREQGVIVATDGHRLHAFNHDIDGERKPPRRKRIKSGPRKGKYEMIYESGGAIMPTRAMVAILELVKEAKIESVELAFYDNVFFTASAGDAFIQGKLIDGSYPQWRQVVPANCNTTLFDPEQVKAIMPELVLAHKINAGANKSLPLKISKGIAVPTFCHDDLKISWPVSIDWEFEAGFDARYLADLCGGVMHYKDPSSPFKVIDRRGGTEKLAVIMPLRV